MSNSSTITEEPLTGHDYASFRSPLPHPGEHLREDYLPDYDLTAEALATAMGLSSPAVLQALLAEEQDMTPELALRLSRVFQTTPDIWLALQKSHDLSKTAIAMRDELARIRPLAAA